MISTIALGFGLVLIFEGLVFALAPSRLDDLVRALNALSRDQRRLIGLAALGLGIGFIWLSGAF